MRRRITNVIHTDYMNCPYKAYLKINGENGRKTDFEVMQDELSEEYKVSTSGFLQDRWKNEQIISNLSLRQFRENLYTKGINIRDKSERFDVIFDGILKEHRSSEELVPVIFINKENLTIYDRLQLAFCGFALGEMPSFGRIIHGTEHSNIRVKLDKLIARVRLVVEDIESFTSGHDPPQVHINKHCQICEFGNDCMKTAMENDNLSLISRLSAKEIKKLNNKGIFTVNQLSYTFKPRRKRKTNRPKLNPYNPALKALALRENKVHVFEAPEFPRNDIEIYLDIENLPDRNFYYLIGVLINDRGTVSEYSFWADKQDQQYKIFQDLLNILDRYDDYTIYHYGQFEKRYLKKMLKNLEGSNKKSAEAILDRCCNILSFFYSNIYIPTYSNGLKDVAKYLGFNWRKDEASGIQSIIWRMDWEKSRSCQTKKKLLEYNMDDCYALRKVKDFVSSINESKDDTLSLDANIVFQSQIKSTSAFKFWTGEYADPAIESLHKYSLFDYQRQRVFVRTDDF